MREDELLDQANRAEKELPPDIIAEIDRETIKNTAVIYQRMSEAVKFYLNKSKTDATIEEKNEILKALGDYLEYIKYTRERTCYDWVKFMNSPEASFEHFLKTKGLQK